jgi:beta-galactosidase
MTQFTKSILVLIIVLFSNYLFAQSKYTIDVKGVKNDIIRGHLDLGGSNSAGDSIGVNSFYIERNGKPFIPVIGEFHYSRFPNQYWDEELKKMKAGGINVVATYVFWILHEFTENQFDWTGDLDLRHFVELCKSNELDVIVRIGPFAHGEIRNGGLPDWLYGRPIEVRSNDPVYLFYTNRFYQQIGQQLAGLMFKDEGPVIGIQLENEYQHSAAPWAFTYTDAPKERTVARHDNKITLDGVGINSLGNEFADMGRDHMKTLKELAQKAGLIAPIYTATGWGYATIVEKGSIPVMAGYAYPFWVPSSKPSPFYLYKNIHQNPDYSPVSYDVNLYPSMAAELGTGISVTYSRRPRVPGESFLPMMVRTVGSGTNGLGFYMYHGGTTPSIGNFFLNEGAGLANKSYDYQSPIGEFGKVSSGYYPLKLINLFLKSYSSELAPLYPVLPASNEGITPEDTNTLRFAVRSNGEKGFLFMHNFQDKIETVDLTGLSIDVQTQSGKVRFPETGHFTLKSGSSAIFPFNMDYSGVAVYMATVQPLCHLVNNKKNYHVFFSIDGITPTMLFKGKVKIMGDKLNVQYKKGNTVIQLEANKPCRFEINGTSFLVLPYQKALDAYLVGKAGEERLVLSTALVLEDPYGLSLISDNQTLFDVSIFPKASHIEVQKGQITKKEQTKDFMDHYTVQLPEVKPELELVKADDRHFVLRASKLEFSSINDVFIKFDYRGDRGICMLGGHLACDNLYTSQPWVLGLKRFQNQLKQNDMYFYFLPMRNDAPYLVYLDKETMPDFGNKKEFLEIKKPEIWVEYKVRLKIQ